MDDQLMQRMRQHISRNEGTLPNPYKDSKNKLTVGTGFLVDDEKSFVAMPFEIEDRKTGELRPATEAEKKVEFTRAKGLSNDQLTKGPTKSPLSLPDSENQRRLDSEITTRLDRVKTEIGEADWNKLTDGQKTAVLDVHYANPGGLDNFPELKKAIKKGDAREMANQSDFHGGQIEGTEHQHRNFDRLRRNKAAMQGIDAESDEAYRQVADSYPDHPSLPDKYKDHRDLSVLRPEPRPQDAQDQAGQPSQSAPEPAPQPQPAPAPEQKQPEALADPRVTAMTEMAAAPIANPGQAALPERSSAYGPYTKLGGIAEDGTYGPQTDFALKHATARLGPAKVEDGLALGRFNTFARAAQANGNADGLEDRTHGISGSLFRDPADTTAPKVEAGALQQTLNGFGHDLKVAPRPKPLSAMC